ncbi:hypothetical protein ASZ78_003121 [Callipepla squamata]|uniref:GC-rich sequence DNA-binding factor 2 n=1 Tax=Callipepla squamata TaxID=9009 RepID=A0A226MI21_CALSU|nr:hypothetical protein ASZ78_003121 [Callipepla squamata]
MFRRPPRNFRGRRRRAASSGSSSGGEERDEERGVGSAPLPGPGPGPDGGAESEESERDRGGAASSSEGARAAAEPPPPPEEPARGGRAPLSFGSDEEEREGDKELFKIKKPSFNEVTFRIQKKENPLSAEREADESKSCVAAAWRKRHLARSRADYLPLDVSRDGQRPRRRGSSDSESEDESDMNHLHFVPEMRTLRHRMAEHTVPVGDESTEDEAETKWEEQQIRKAVKLSQEIYSDASQSESQPVKLAFDPCVSLPPVNLETVKKRLIERIASLQDVHRAHLREHEKYMEDMENSKLTVQELEKSSDAAMNYKFYRTMKTYVENLVNCFNEKLAYIDELEFAVHALLQQRAMSVLKRRQEELKTESAYMQHLATGNDKPTDDGLESDEKMKLLETCGHQRARRRQRERSHKAGHHEGMSSDDELTVAELSEFQKSKA